MEGRRVKWLIHYVVRKWSRLYTLDGRYIRESSSPLGARQAGGVFELPRRNDSSVLVSSFRSWSLAVCKKKAPLRVENRLRRWSHWDEIGWSITPKSGGSIPTKSGGPNQRKSSTQCRACRTPMLCCEVSEKISGRMYASAHLYRGK